MEWLLIITLYQNDIEIVEVSSSRECYEAAEQLNDREVTENRGIRAFCVSKEKVYD